MTTSVPAKGWVIWSEEHGAWWAPGGRGYILSLRHAGRYSAEHAAAIVARANAHCRPGVFYEIAIPDPFAHDMARHQDDL